MSYPRPTGLLPAEATLVIGREIDARRAVGFQAVGGAFRGEGHGVSAFSQAGKPDDDHFVSDVDHLTRGSCRQDDAALSFNGRSFGESHRLSDCVAHNLTPRLRIGANATDWPPALLRRLAGKPNRPRRHHEPLESRRKGSFAHVAAEAGYVAGLFVDQERAVEVVAVSHRSEPQPRCAGRLDRLR